MFVGSRPQDNELNKTKQNKTNKYLTQETQARTFTAVRIEWNQRCYT